MTDIDGIWRELEQKDRDWGIVGNPFVEAMTDIEILREVFTGRVSEIKTVVQQLRSVNRSRVLVYGNVGIGKTAFITMILDLFERQEEKTLTAQISLPPKTELSTAALIALALKMPHDEDAKKILDRFGVIGANTYQKGGTTIKAAWGILNLENTTEDTPQQQIQFADLAFNGLLDRVLQTHGRVIIAVDDLDKQDPSTAKDLLLNAQGLLKSKASFILTGHPSGLSRELLLSSRGLFDRTEELIKLDFDTTKLMLLNYLNSARDQAREITDDYAFAPFSSQAADLICRRSNGSPRILNRIGNYALAEGTEQNLIIIDVQTTERAINKARKAFRDQFNEQERLLLNSITETGILSDSNISLKELQQLGAKSFAELLPVLEELQRRDLIERLPNDGSISYKLSPLMLPAEPPQPIDPPT